MFVRDNAISGSSLSCRGTVCGTRQCRYKPQFVPNKPGSLTALPKLIIYHWKDMPVVYSLQNVCSYVVVFLWCYVSPSHLLSSKAVGGVLLGPG